MPAANASDAGTVTIGDITINRIGLGTNRIEDDDASKSILNGAVEHGVNFVDTADIYTGGASELTIGQTIARRDGVHVATKGGYYGAAPDAISASLDKSLQRLGLDTIDLYYLHRPDPKYPIEQSVEAILEGQRAGKIRHIGLSSVDVEQIQKIQKLTHVAAVQNEYNLGNTKGDEVVDYCTREGIAFVPFFPLRSANKAAAVAERHGATVHQIVLASMLARSPMVTPIPGTRSIEHLESNLAAASIELSNADLAELGLS
jgi:aryl-alcohol dehydrogenase-like predicted oxidoreductase